MQRYHERAKIELPNAKVHAVIHTIVENQLAEDVPEVIGMFERLRGEGLERRACVRIVMAGTWSIQKVAPLVYLRFPLPIAR